MYIPIKKKKKGKLSKEQTGINLASKAPKRIFEFPTPNEAGRDEF
jgi:hypothetical protein